MLLRRTLLIAGLLTLGACAAPMQRDQKSADWSVHRDKLSGYTQWTASGKLALRTSDRSESASLVWQQAGDQSHLKLSGPMGLNATEVSSDGQRIDIVQGDERQSFDVSSPEAVRLNTGWELPVQSLPYWLKGLPSPHLEVESLELDPQHGLLSDLQQNGWQIQYQEYDDFGAHTLPTRLRIERDDTLVKIVLQNWRAGINL